MKQKRHTTEQLIQILRKADGEKTVEELCREFNISEQTLYRWRRKYGPIKMATSTSRSSRRRTRKLKKTLADEMLNIRVLKETLKKVVSA